MNMNDFFEKAIALRDTIDQSEDILKDIKLDILSQLVGTVFYHRKVPNNFTVQSSCMDAAKIALTNLHDLGIEGEITINKTFYPSYAITLAHILVSP